MSTDNLTREIPLSLRSVTMEDSSHGFNESRSVMTKDNLKLLDLSSAVWHLWPTSGKKAWNRQEAWYGLEQTVFASKQ